MEECCSTMLFNPFKPNEISYSYQMDQTMSVLTVVGWYFFNFIQNFERKFCQKQTVETLIRCSVLLRLIWVCTVCTCPPPPKKKKTKKQTLGLYGSSSQHLRKRVSFSQVSKVGF